MNTLCTNATVCDMILKRVTCVESLCPFPVIKSSDQSMRLPGKLTCRHSIHHQRVYNVPTKSWWPCNTRPLVNCYSFFDSDLNQEDGTNLCIPCMQRILWYRPYINIFFSLACCVKKVWCLWPLFRLYKPLLFRRSLHKDIGKQSNV